MSQTIPPQPTIPPPGAAAERTPADQIARILTLARRGLRYWRVPLAIVVLGLSLSIFFASRIPHTYVSETTLLVKSRLRAGNQGDFEGSGPLVARLRDIVTTRSCLEPVMRRFHVLPLFVANRGEEEAANQMKTLISLRGLQSSRFILSYEGETKEQARDVTQALAEMLIDEYANGGVNEAKRNADFLQQQVGTAEIALERATLDLSRFVNEHSEFAILSTTSTAGAIGALHAPSPSNASKSVIEQTSDPELAALYRQRARIEAEARAALPVGTGPSAAAAAIDEARVQAKSEVEISTRDYAKAQADVESKSSLTDDHPDMKSAKASLASASRRLAQAKAALAAVNAQASGGAIEAPVATADGPTQERLRQLDRQIVARQIRLRTMKESDAASGAQPDAAVAAASDTDVMGKLETEWERLVGAVSAARAHHDDMRTRAEAASLGTLAAESAAKDVMTIVEPPTLPRVPFTGNRAKTALMGAVVTLLVAFGYAAIRVFLNDTIEDTSDIEALQLLSVLGTLDRIEDPDSVSSQGSRSKRSREKDEPRGS